LGGAPERVEDHQAIALREPDLPDVAVVKCGEQAPLDVDEDGLDEQPEVGLAAVYPSEIQVRIRSDIAGGKYTKSRVGSSSAGEPVTLPHDRPWIWST
jgi:hypothetical protein